MKKINRTNFIPLLITLMLMTCVLIGCSNAATQSKETTQVTVEEETTEVAESDVVPEEVTAEEPEVVEEKQPAEETLANELIMNSDPIQDWVKTLEEDDLKFIIYNDVEGYKQILNDGETYHMKKDDKIFLYHPVGGINNIKVLTPEIYIKAEGVIYTDCGYSVDILWQDKEVVTYGEELIMSGNDQTPKSVTCTFYKATE